jgi:PepSY-associated TM region
MRSAFQVHRWAGITSGIAAFVAFMSGLALHWHTYVFPTEREVVQSYGAPLSPAEIDGNWKVPLRTPQGEPIGEATLRHLNDRLVWELEPAAGGATELIDVRTGERVDSITKTEATRLAARVLGREDAEGHAELIRDYDHFYYLRSPPLPVYRVAFHEPRRADVYIDHSNGNVTAVVGWRERVTEVLGEKLHYLKIGSLRTKTTPRFVVMAVFTTAVLTSAISGLLYGVPLLIRRLSQPHAPRPVLRTIHNLAGVVVGVFIVMWGTSSYLMLWYPTMDPSQSELARLAGNPLVADEFRLSPRAALSTAIAATHSAVFALQARRLLERPVYTAIHADGTANLIDGRSGALLSPVSDSLVRAIVGRYVGSVSAIHRVTYLNSYDEYYHATHDDRGYSFDGYLRPLPVYRVDLRDGNEPSPLYIRSDRGQLISRVGADYRAFRWLGSAVHNLNFPALFARRPGLWSAAIVLPALCGLLASASGVWLGATYVAHALGSRAGRRGVV